MNGITKIDLYFLFMGSILKPLQSVHSVMQLSLLVSDWSSCHFYGQSPCCCGNLCTHRRVGLKIWCGQVHCWCIAILTQQKVTAPLTDKNLVLSQWRSIFQQFKRCAHYNAWFRLHDIFVYFDSHNVRLGGCGVVKSCCDMANRQNRRHLGARPIIPDRLS